MPEHHRNHPGDGHLAAPTQTRLLAAVRIRLFVVDVAVGSSEPAFASGVASAHVAAAHTLLAADSNAPAVVPRTGSSLLAERMQPSVPAFPCLDWGSLPSACMGLLKSSSAAVIFVLADSCFSH